MTVTAYRAYVPADLVKVGPKGYIHGWVYVGPGHVGARIHDPDMGHGSVTRRGKKTTTILWDNRSHGEGGVTTYEHGDKPAGHADWQHFRMRQSAPRKAAAPKAPQPLKVSSPRELPSADAPDFTGGGVRERDAMFAMYDRGDYSRASLVHALRSTASNFRGNHRARQHATPSEIQAMDRNAAAFDVLAREAETHLPARRVTAPGKATPTPRPSAASAAGPKRLPANLHDAFERIVAGTERHHMADVSGVPAPTLTALRRRGLLTHELGRKASLTSAGAEYWDHHGPNAAAIAGHRARVGELRADLERIHAEPDHRRDWTHSQRSSLTSQMLRAEESKWQQARYTNYDMMRDQHREPAVRSLPGAYTSGGGEGFTSPGETKPSPGLMTPANAARFLRYAADHETADTDLDPTAVHRVANDVESGRTTVAEAKQWLTDLADKWDYDRSKRGVEHTTLLRNMADGLIVRERSGDRSHMQMRADVRAKRDAAHAEAFAAKWIADVVRAGRTDEPTDENLTAAFAGTARRARPELYDQIRAEIKRQTGELPAEWGPTPAPSGSGGYTAQERYAQMLADPNSPVHPVGTPAKRREYAKRYDKMTREEFDALDPGEKDTILANLRRIVEVDDRSTRRAGMGISVRGTDSDQKIIAGRKIREFTRPAPPPPEDRTPSAVVSRIRAATTRSSRERALRGDRVKPPSRAELADIAREGGWSSALSSGLTTDKMIDRILREAETGHVSAPSAGDGLTDDERYAMRTVREARRNPSVHNLTAAADAKERVHRQRVAAGTAEPGSVPDYDNSGRVVYQAKPPAKAAPPTPVKAAPAATGSQSLRLSPRGKKGDLAVLESDTSSFTQGRGYERSKGFELVRVAATNRDGVPTAYHSLRHGTEPAAGDRPVKIPARGADRYSFHVIPRGSVDEQAAIATAAANRWHPDRPNDPLTSGRPYGSLDEVKAALAPHVTTPPAAPVKAVKRPAKAAKPKPLFPKPSGPAAFPLAPKAPKDVTYKEPEGLKPGAKVTWAHHRKDGTEVTRTGRVWDAGPGRSVWVIPDEKHEGDPYSAINVSQSGGRLYSSDTNSLTVAAAEVAHRHRYGPPPQRFGQFEIEQRIGQLGGDTHRVTGSPTADDPTLRRVLQGFSPYATAEQRMSPDEAVADLRESARVYRTVASELKDATVTARTADLYSQLADWFEAEQAKRVAAARAQGSMTKALTSKAVLRAAEVLVKAMEGVRHAG